MRPIHGPAFLLIAAGAAVLLAGAGGQGGAQGYLEKTAALVKTGEDIRFTAKNGLLYAIALAWPESGRLVASLPADQPCDFALTLKITLLPR